MVEDGCARARVCSYDSSLCRAAVLMGLVSNATGGNVSVAFVSNAYTGAVTSGNGVTTKPGSWNVDAFVFPGMGACAGQRVRHLRATCVWGSLYWCCVVLCCAVS